MVASWRGLLPSVFHKTKIIAARTMAPPTAIPATAPPVSGEDLLELLDGEGGEDDDALEGPDFGVVAAVVVGLGFVPVEVIVAAAPT